MLRLHTFVVVGCCLRLVDYTRYTFVVVVGWITFCWVDLPRLLDLRLLLFDLHFDYVGLHLFGWLLRSHGCYVTFYVGGLFYV